MVVSRVDRQRTRHKGLEFLLCARTSCSVLYITVLHCTVRYCALLLFITVSFYSSILSVHDMIRNCKVKVSLWLLFCEEMCGDEGEVGKEREGEAEMEEWREEV
jgi:hypothetical protein